MFEPNIAKILDAIGPADVVLDIGGWACPFNRANFVLDAEPYATRGYYKKIGLPASQGGEREHFTADTWIRRDICDHTPYPFRDKEIDFVICSHVLEDIRDPLWVCAEMMRISKRGYIEVPSREWETCRGLERPGQVGLSHHRWLIEIDRDEMVFHPKYHLIHSHWRFSLPASHGRRLPPERTVSWLWWQGAFTAREATIHGVQNLESELENFVQRTRPYPGWQRSADRWLRQVGRLAARVTGGVGRALRGEL